MATQAAVLTILVKANSAQATSSLRKTQGVLKDTDRTARKAALGVDETGKSAKRSARAFGSMRASGGKLKSSVGVLGTTAKASGVLLGAAGLAGAVKMMSKEAAEARKVTAQTNAVLKSTAGAAGVSKKAVTDLANALSRKTGIDDEAIQSTENLLLTFTKIKGAGGIFKQATTLATDMSVALGQSGKTSAIQLGKALNDPVKGITSLMRVGVAFPASQKKVITSLAETGHMAQAQKLILKELATEFGGSAAAAATPMAKLKVTMGNVAETAGTALAPAVDAAAKGLNTFITGMQNGTGAGGAFAGAIGSAFASVSGWVKRNQATFQAFGQAVANVFNFLKPAIGAALGGIVQRFKGWAQIMVGIVKVFSGLFTGNFGLMWDGIKTIFRGIFNTIVGTLRLVVAPGLAIAKAIMGAILSPFRGGWTTVKGVFSSGAHAAVNVLKAMSAPARAAAKFFARVIVVEINTLKSIPGKMRSVFNSVVGVIKSLPGKVGGAMKAFGAAVKNGIVAGFTAAVNKVIDFVNVILSVIDKIPGVNPGRVGHIGGGGGKKTHSESHPQLAARGAKITKPTAIVGEQAPRHPEYVLATNPAYRKRNLGLFAAAGHELGVPGFALGGLIGKAGNAGHNSGGLPSAKGLGWLSGLGGYLLKAARDFIKAQATQFVGKAGGPKGVVPYRGLSEGIAKWVKASLEHAKKKGVYPQPTSGYRSPAHNAAVGGAKNSQHMLTQYPGGAVDFGGFHSGLQEKMAVVGATSDFKWPLLAPKGFVDDGHASGTGHYRGGIIGHFAKGGRWGRALGALKNAGFREGKGLKTALAVGGAESVGYTDMTGDANLGGSYGPWMVHHPSHPEYNISKLQRDWTYAAKAAYQISSGGRNWHPWTTFNTGAYRGYLGRAAATIKAGRGGHKRKGRPRRGHRPGHAGIINDHTSVGGPLASDHAPLAVGGRDIVDVGAYTAGSPKGQHFTPQKVPRGKGQSMPGPDEGGDTGTTDDAAAAAAANAEAWKAFTAELAAGRKQQDYLFHVQGPQMLAALAVMMSSNMGRAAGLGRQTPLAAGRVASL